MNPRITLVQENSFLQPPPPRSTRHPQQNKLKDTASPTKPVFRYRTSPTTRASTTTYTSTGSSSTSTKSGSTFPSTVKQSTAFHTHASTTHLPTSLPKVSTTLPSIMNKSRTVTTTQVSSNDTKTSANIAPQNSTVPVFSSQRFEPSLDFENIELEDAVKDFNQKDIEAQNEKDNESLRKDAF